MKPSRPQDYHDRDVLFSHQTPPHGHGSISSNSDSMGDANAVQTGTTGTYNAAYPSSPSSIATYANFNSSGNANNNSSSSSSSPRHGHPQQQQQQQHQHQHQHHGKHSKHSKHGSDNRDDMSKSSSAASVRSGSGSGSGYGNSHGSSYDPDSPSIQQTLYPIPSLPSHEGNGSSSIPTTIATTTMTGEPVLGENVMLQEWLQKRSASLQLVWKRRWCVLRDDRLYYYRSNTDHKPIGVLHLAEYSVLTYGPDISRKSKFAFRLSSPVSTAHQQQHHLFYTDSAQSLHNWTYSLQLHISRTAAAWADVVAASTGASLHGGRVDQAPAMAPGGEQSIIDKVLDRLHLEDTPVSSSSSSSLNMHGASALQSVVSSTQSRSRTPAPEADRNQPPFLPHIPTNFPLLVEDNNDTYSSTSSIPNSSHNISSNLEDIFNLSHQSSAPVKEPSMESMRNPRSYQQTEDYSYVGLAPGGLQQQPSDRTASNVSIGRYPTAEQESDMSEGTRSSMQSTTDQGRTSLQQPRPTMAVSGHGVYPIRSSVYSGVSMDNSVPSPTTSAAGSPYSSPVLTYEPASVKAHYPAPSGGQVPPSPRTLYEILDNSSPQRPASAASSTSISTIASFGDASTYNDNSFDNGAGTTESNNVQGPTKNSGGNVGANHGPKLFGFVTGGKHRKKERPGNSSSASSSHSGSGSANSSGLKLFTSGICSYSGCVQQAKTCIYHNKKYRLEQSRREDPKGQEKAAEGGKSKKFWQGGSDRSQGTMSALASPLPLSSHGFSSPTSSSFSGAGGGSRGLSSKSMVSLSRDSDMTMEASSAPLPPGHLLGMVTSPAKRRSPSVSVVDDALVATQQQMQQQQQQQQRQRQPRQPYVSAPIQPLPSILTTNSKMPPPAAAPIQALLPPPHHVSIASHHQQPQPAPQGESELLNRNMEAQIGPDFGAFDPTNKSTLAGSALDGKFFVANHHRTMQTLQAKMHPAALPNVPAKSQSPLPTVPQLSDIQLQQRLLQQQTNDYNGGVSRRIIAPDELALAIREEAEEMQRKQAQLQEAQRNRPTSMIKGSNYPSSGGLSTELSTVSETSASTDEYNSPTTSRVNSPQDSTSSHIQEGIERIINYQDSQLTYATGQGEVQSLDSLKSPISRIAAVTHPHSPAATVPLSPSVPHPSGSASTIVDSGILSPGIQTGYIQQSHQITNSSSSLPTSLIDDKQSGFPTSSLLPPKRRGKDLPPPQGSASGYESRNPGRGEGGHVREMSVHSPIPLTTAFPKDAVIHYGGALATHTTAGSNGGSGNIAALATGAAAPSLRPGPTTRRGSASPVMIRLNEHGGQNISPLLGTGVTKTFIGEAPSSDIGRPDLTPTTSPSSSSLSTSTVTSSLSSFVTSRNIGSDSHGARTGAAMKESLAMSGLEQGQPTPVFEVTSPTIPRNKTFQSAHSPLSSMTPANGASPSGSPVISVGSSSPSATTTSDSTYGAFSAMPVTAISAGGEGQRARSALAHSPSKSPSNQEGSAAPRRMMLQSAASFVFPAPSPSSKSAGTADGNRARSGSSDSGSSSGTGDDHDYGMSGQSSQAGSPVISPSIHAAALEMYPGLRKLSLFTAAVGGHPPPALIGSRKNSDSGLSSASSRDYGSQGHQHYHAHHYQQHQTTSKLRYGHRRQRTSSSDDGGYEDEEEDGDSDDHEDVNNDTQSEDLQHDEDWAGNWRAMRRPNEPAAEATVHRRSSVPALQSSLASLSPSNPMPPLPPRKAPSSTVPTSLSSPPPFLETSGSNIKSTTTPKSPMVAKPVSSPLPSSILTSITSSSTPLPTSSLTAMPPIQPASPSQALFGTGAGGAPPIIPPRSPRRSVPASPTTLRSPRSHQNLPTVSAMHSNNSGNDNVNEGAKSSTQQ
ncbi:hypothetical protein BGZ98_002660 [Dissophora globulifera]|nr:hypothetical protein BGZ98_002660 [Dissophora globulifera]